MLKYFFLSFIIFPGFFILHVAGQSDSQQEKASTCEEARSVYDEAIAYSLRSSDKNVILIFSEGRNENQKALIERRIKAVKEHIRFRGVNNQSFVFAVGERVSGLGRLDIYVDGKKAWTLYAGRNAQLGSDCLAEPF
jgi:hypothetical protein